MGNATAHKKYRVVSEFISEDSDDFSQRFFQITQAALNRTEAAKAFFSSGARNADDSHSKTFFQQLENKKVLHLRIIEKIGRDSELLPFPINSDAPEHEDAVVYSNDHSVFRTAEPTMHIRNIFEIVYEKALDELNFYLNFLLLEKHPVITSLLLSLANLSKDFLFEVKLRYLEHQSQMEIGNPEKIVEHFFTLEHRYN
jgi:hypothetical protein